jgi:hypothetical protein
MKHLYRITVVLLVYVAGIWLFNYFREEPPVLPAPEPAPEASSSDTVTRITSPDPLYDRLIANRVTTLTELARYREHLARANLHSLRTRQQAAAEAYPAWTEAVQTNKATYLKLLEEAKHAANGKVVCSICNYTSYIPCAMCKDHDGKCTTCGGTGSDVGHEFCPSCSGKGKCYLCNGSGKMFCPFCDDGMIRTDWPPPTSFPPLY